MDTRLLRERWDMQWEYIKLTGLQRDKELQAIRNEVYKLAMRVYAKSN